MKLFLFFTLLTFPQIHGEQFLDLTQKMEQKIIFKSEGMTILEQLNRFSKISGIKIKYNNPEHPNFNQRTIKYSYINTKAKYVLKRIAKEAGMIYIISEKDIQISDHDTLSLAP